MVQRALQPGVGAGRLDVHVERIFPGLSPQRPRLDLGQVDVAQREPGQRLEQRARLAVQREHHRRLVRAPALSRAPGDYAEPRDVVAEVLDRFPQDGEAEDLGGAARGDRGRVAAGRLRAPSSPRRRCRRRRRLRRRVICRSAFSTLRQRLRVRVDDLHVVERVPGSASRQWSTRSSTSPTIGRSCSTSRS